MRLHVVLFAKQGVSFCRINKIGDHVMPLKELLNGWWIKDAIYGLFAMFGGMMGHLMRTIDRRRKINWCRAVLEGCSAGFGGLLILMVCQEINLSEQWTGVIVGVSGWLGSNATIRMLESILLKKLGISEQPSEHTRKHRDDY
jgi:LydA holin phage, holin superfamily III